MVNVGFSFIMVRDIFYSKSIRKGVRWVFVLMIKSKFNDEIFDFVWKLWDDGIEIYGFGFGDRVEV